MSWLECVKCGEKYDDQEIVYSCKKCNSILDVKYEYDSLGFDLNEARKRRMSVWRYRELLPVKDDKKVTLGEGGTPLYRCRNLEKKLGLKELWVKNEGANPTGAFKDRGMTVGLTKALELGQKIVACASTGNTSASLAAYSSRAGTKCYVLVPSGKIAFGKLAQALVYGAEVFALKGNFDEAMDIVKELAYKGMIYLLNSLNPFRLEGQKTIGHELVDELGYSPDRIIVPVGNAGNISAIWKGILEFKELGYTDSIPKMTGVQAAGSAPIVKMFKEKLDVLDPEMNPETVATAIRIGKPVSWQKAMVAIRSTGGCAESVTDEEIVRAQYLLSSGEGIFVEPASASSIAGLMKLLEAGEIDKDERIVCITTGNGLKDPNIVVDHYKDRIIEVESMEEIVERIKKV